MKFSLVTLAISVTLTIAAPTMSPRDMSNEGHAEIESAKRGTAIFMANDREFDIEKRGLAVSMANDRGVDI
ncbi:hypothetical protein N7463_005053 [Penicillium fimorum]|uniref:Uncharacterized protein n=1 Tax=Penicillium fimorum TaxID=1882269 RepID=A0A9W9XRV7_9EURO|nr:hypothetical protein N7463_005053 [Penicillium fimorum]